MFNKWASQQQKKSHRVLTVHVTVYSFLFLSNTNRPVFNALGLCDSNMTYIKHSYDFDSVLMMLRQQV